jgi:cobalt-zinc-cadmium efflux system membrane fusion protein
MFRPIAVLCAALLAVACGSPTPVPEDNETTEAHAEDAVALTARQITAAAITLGRPERGGAGASIGASALIESDPQATRIVAAPLAGRIVSLTRNLGDTVRRGETLAVIESREAAALQADIARARTQLQLARATQARDEALYARGFRPLREVEISRAATTDANVALKLAQQQVAASGLRGGSLNRIVITAPIGGQVIARSAVLGQVFTPDAAETELFRIANLARLTVVLSLPPAEAARVRPGAIINVSADGRAQSARVRFVSPVLDPETRLVRVLGDLDNSGGEWRAGEPVQARIRLSGGSGTLLVPAAAVQTIDSESVVFVRTPAGFRAVPVTLGQREGSRVAITAGLTGDEVVATGNSFILKAELGKGEAAHGEH